MTHLEFPHLATASHECYVGEAGVALYNTDQLEENQDPAGDQLMFLSPYEALQIAEYIEAHRTDLEAHQRKLETQFEQVSQAVLSLFMEIWRREQFEHRRKTHSASTPDDLDQSLNDAYTQLVLDESGPVRQWYTATWTDKFSHEQQETLFWRYFNSRYRNDLLKEFFPENDDEEEEDEGD